MVTQLLKRYWMICRFKIGPQDTPSSSHVTILGIVLLFVIMLCQLMIGDISGKLSIAMALYRALVIISGLIAYTYIILLIKNMKSRFQQTVSSLLYCNIIIHLIAFPLVLIGPLIAQLHSIKIVFILLAVIYFLIMIFLNVWQVLINAHIYKNALDLDYLAALFVSFGLLAVNLFLFTQLVR
jgi:hypothetical protein